MHMSSLVKIPEKFAANLLPLEKNALTAYYQLKIKEVTKLSMVQPLSEAITKAFIVMGSTPKDDFQLIVEEVLNELKTSFSTFTIQEVCIAIDLGSKGKLGDEFVHVHIKAILKWIWLYNEKIRREAIHKQKEYEEKTEKQLQEFEHKEKIRMFEATIIGRYNGFPESLINDNYGEMAAYYRHLTKRVQVNVPLEKKNELFAAAEKIKEEDRLLAEQNFRSIKIEYTSKQIAEANALKYLFASWQFEKYDLGADLRRPK